MSIPNIFAVTQWDSSLSSHLAASFLLDDNRKCNFIQAGKDQSQHILLAPVQSANSSITIVIENFSYDDSVNFSFGLGIISSRGLNDSFYFGKLSESWGLVSSNNETTNIFSSGKWLSSFRNLKCGDSMCIVSQLDDSKSASLFINDDLIQRFDLRQTSNDYNNFFFGCTFSMNISIAIISEKNRPKKLKLKSRKTANLFKPSDIKTFLQKFDATALQQINSRNDSNISIRSIQDYLNSEEFLSNCKKERIKTVQKRPKSADVSHRSHNSISKTHKSSKVKTKLHQAVSIDQTRIAGKVTYNPVTYQQIKIINSTGYSNINNAPNNILTDRPESNNKILEHGLWQIESEGDNNNKEEDLVEDDNLYANDFDEITPSVKSDHNLDDVDGDGVGHPEKIIDNKSNHSNSLSSYQLSPHAGKDKYPTRDVREIYKVKEATIANGTEEETVPLCNTLSSRNVSCSSNSLDIPVAITEEKQMSSKFVADHQEKEVPLTVGYIMPPPNNHPSAPTVPSPIAISRRQPVPVPLTVADSFPPRTVTIPSNSRHRAKNILGGDLYVPLLPNNSVGESIQNSIQQFESYHNTVRNSNLTEAAEATRTTTTSFSVENEEEEEEAEADLPIGLKITMEKINHKGIKEYKKKKGKNIKYFPSSQKPNVCNNQMVANRSQSNEDYQSPVIETTEDGNISAICIPLTSFFESINQQTIKKTGLKNRYISSNNNDSGVDCFTTFIANALSAALSVPQEQLPADKEPVATRTSTENELEAKKDSNGYLSDYDPKTGRKILLSRQQYLANKQQAEFHRQRKACHPVATQEAVPSPAGGVYVEPKFPGQCTRDSTEGWVARMRRLAAMHHPRLAGDLEDAASPVRVPDSWRELQSVASCYSFYGSMQPCDLILSVEHCSDCRGHTSLRHCEPKYLYAAEHLLLDLTLYVNRQLQPLVRLGLFRIPQARYHKYCQGCAAADNGLSPLSNTRTGMRTGTHDPDTKQFIPLGGRASRYGSFEVQVAFLHPKEGLRYQLLHSKLRSSQWPGLPAVQRKLFDFIRNNNIQTWKEKSDSLLYSPSCLVNSQHDGEEESCPCDCRLPYDKQYCNVVSMPANFSAMTIGSTSIVVDRNRAGVVLEEEAGYEDPRAQVCRAMRRSNSLPYPPLSNYDLDAYHRLSDWREALQREKDEIQEFNRQNEMDDAMSYHLRKSEDDRERSRERFRELGRYSRIEMRMLAIRYYALDDNKIEYPFDASDQYKFLKFQEGDKVIIGNSACLSYESRDKVFGVVLQSHRNGRYTIRCYTLNSETAIPNSTETFVNFRNASSRSSRDDISAEVRKLSLSEKTVLTGSRRSSLKNKVTALSWIEKTIKESDIVPYSSDEIGGILFESLLEQRQSPSDTAPSDDDSEEDGASEARTDLDRVEAIPYENEIDGKTGKISFQNIPEVSGPQGLQIGASVKVRHAAFPDQLQGGVLTAGPYNGAFSVLYESGFSEDAVTIDRIIPGYPDGCLTFYYVGGPARCLGKTLTSKEEYSFCNSSCAIPLPINEIFYWKAVIRGVTNVGVGGYPTIGVSSQPRPANAHSCYDNCFNGWRSIGATCVAGKDIYGLDGWGGMKEGDTAIFRYTPGFKDNAPLLSMFLARVNRLFSITLCHGTHWIHVNLSHLEESVTLSFPNEFEISLAET